MTNKDFSLILQSHHHNSFHVQRPIYTVQIQIIHTHGLEKQQDKVEYGLNKRDILQDINIVILQNVFN